MFQASAKHDLIIRRVALWLLAALLALLSVFFQRSGPETVQHGNLCGPSGAEPCTRPVLKGGLPVAFLLDAPGVSVEDQLAFGEDHFLPGAFMIDCAVHAIAVWLSLRAAARLRRRIARPAS